MNFWQSPVSSFGQAQAARQLVRYRGERGFGLEQLGGRQQFERHVRVLQHGDVLRGAVELLLRAEHLQRAAGAAFVIDAGVRAQRLQAVAAVFGEAHHAALVDRIALLRAVLQHLPHPLQLERGAVEADRERRVLLEHPLDGLQRHARRRPWRRVARRNLAGIGEARFERGAGFTVDHRDFVARAGEVIGARDADDAASQNDDTHEFSVLIRDFRHSCAFDSGSKPGLTVGVVLSPILLT